MSTDKIAHLNSTDRRVFKTKRALKNALIGLLNEKELNKITVTELTNRANVNRATFYFYYSDVTDMLKKIQDEDFEDFTAVAQNFERITLDEDGITDYLKKVIDFLIEVPGDLNFVFNFDINRDLLVRVSKYMQTIVPNSRKHFSKSNPAHFTTSFTVNGIISTLVIWLNEGMPVPPEELARYIAKIYINGCADTLDFYKEEEQKQLNKSKTTGKLSSR